jgi:hypothetical protein
MTASLLLRHGPFSLLPLSGCSLMSALTLAELAISLFTARLLWDQFYSYSGEEDFSI